jgi:formamidopyrimidine-DNA glycosylase
MPEGPEVFLFAKAMNKRMAGTILLDVDLIGKYQENHDPPDLFIEMINELPCIILNVKAKGKLLIITLQNGFNIYSSLGMTGHWGDKISKHTHVVLEVKSHLKRLSSEIVYTDPRRFGKFRISKSTAIADDIGQSLLDISREEYIKKAQNINPTKWVAKVLIDQRQICSGVGNYLLSEIMHAADINRNARMADVTNSGNSMTSKSKWGRVYDVSLRLMKESIKKGGASLSNYFDFTGQKGTFQETFCVYGQIIDFNGRKVSNEKGKHGRNIWYVNEEQEKSVE